MELVRFLGTHLPALRPWKMPLVRPLLWVRHLLTSQAALLDMSLSAVSRRALSSSGWELWSPQWELVLNWGLLRGHCGSAFHWFSHETPLNCIRILNVLALPCIGSYLVTFPVLLLPENSVSAWQHLMLFLPPSVVSFVGPPPPVASPPLQVALFPAPSGRDTWSKTENGLKGMWWVHLCLPPSSPVHSSCSSLQRSCLHIMYEHRTCQYAHVYTDVTCRKSEPASPQICMDSW